MTLALLLSVARKLKVEVVGIKYTKTTVPWCAMLLKSVKFAGRQLQIVDLVDWGVSLFS